MDSNKTYGVVKCPGVLECTSNGNCKTMQELAALSSSNGDLLAVTYGATPNKPSTWDFDMIKGCQCSLGYYMGPHVGAIKEYQSYDCSALSCPFGDDPMNIGKVNEQQTIVCTATGGTFTLTFRQQETATIDFGDSLATVQTRLEDLSSITSVTVTFSSGSTVCTSGGTNSTLKEDNNCNSYINGQV